MKRHGISWRSILGVRWGRTASLFLGVVLCAGCGLEDYEKQMAVEQKWAEKFDRITGQEKELLDSPLDMPPKITKYRKNAKGQEEKYNVYPFPQIFLRPPAGIASKPGNPFEAQMLALYPYKGEKEVQRLLVTGTTDKKMGKDEFQERVCKSVGINYRNPPTVPIETLGPPRQEFSLIDGAKGDTTWVLIYFTQDEDNRNNQLALVFEVLAKRKKEIAKEIEVSLGTFESGDRASDVSRAFDNNKSEYYRLRITAK